jgi:hypothetical protein
MPTYVAVTPVAGANLNVADDSARFAVGTKVNASPGDTEFVYVEANGAVSAGDFCEITASGTASRATTAGPRTSVTELGAAQIAVTSGQFFWIARRGYGLTVSVSATTQPGTLYIATTSGKLSNTSASATIQGVLINNASATATITTTTATLTWPRCVLPNG